MDSTMCDVPTLHADLLPDVRHLNALRPRPSPRDRQQHPLVTLLTTQEEKSCNFAFAVSKTGRVPTFRPSNFYVFQVCVCAHAREGETMFCANDHPIEQLIGHYALHAGIRPRFWALVPDRQASDQLQPFWPALVLWRWTWGGSGSEHNFLVADGNPTPFARVCLLL